MGSMTQTDTITEYTTTRGNNKNNTIYNNHKTAAEK